MNAISRLAIAAAALAAQLLIVNTAQAEAVMRCDNCDLTAQQAVALSGPLGYTLVIDTPDAELTLWEVHYDGETRKRTAYQEAVDPMTYDRYLYMLESGMQAKASGQTSVVVPISPGGYNGTLFGGDPFGGFVSINAYDVVNSATVRSQLGTRIAQAMTVNQSQGTILGNLAVTLNSVLMSMGAPGGFTIVITWKDGTKTTFKIDSSTAHQAQYVEGESEDESGNPIPDGAVHSDRAGTIYHGQMRFNTQQSLDRWVQAAINYGIPTSGGSGSRTVSCSWDGRTLDCRGF